MHTLKPPHSSPAEPSFRPFVISFLLLISSSYHVRAQSTLGIGFGSENMHIGLGKLRNLVPHLSYEYIMPDMRATLYFEGTGIKRSYSNNTSYLDGQGQPIPYEENYEYWHILFQAGFKRLLNGDADKKAPIFFAGGGFADCVSINHYTATGTDPQHPLSSSDKGTTNSFGLGFLAGMQYYLAPVIVELKGNLDFLLNQVSEYGGNTNVHTDVRLTILLPLHSFQ